MVEKSPRGVLRRVQRYKLIFGLKCLFLLMKSRSKFCTVTVQEKT